jgi:hypothetical protein
MLRYGVNLTLIDLSTLDILAWFRTAGAILIIIDRLSAKFLLRKSTHLPRLNASFIASCNEYTAASASDLRPVA